MATSTITYKAVVMPAQKRKDGSYNIKIRVTFKRVSRYLSTNLTATAKDITANGELKGSALIAANKLIAQFYQYASDLNFFTLQEMSIDDVIRYIRRKATNGGAFRLDFFEFAYEFIATKNPGTAATYTTAINAFRRFLQVEAIDINEITYQMLHDFGEYIDGEPKQIRVSKYPTVASKVRPYTKKKGLARVCYTRKIKSIYWAAKLKYNDEDNGIANIPRDPFQRLELKCSPSISHSAKSPEWIQRIISYDGPCTGSQRLALDIYIISFALMGMNAVDLLEASAPKKGIVTYYRAKTRDRRPDHAEHRIKIDPRIKPLLDKYKDPEGKRLTNLYLYYRNNLALDYSLRSLLRSWALANDEIPFTLYSARHSWATIARSSRVGADRALVNECLAHIDPDFKIADVYIEKDWSNIWEANTRVLDLFDWSNIKKLASMR